ncbi:MAG: DUF1549 domain-containing protein, partial [Pirellulaceae bacterium]|nr:DUF1549 domain-containing protein [Pirellulaceae bacterium]
MLFPALSRDTATRAKRLIAVRLVASWLIAQCLIAVVVGGEGYAVEPTQEQLDFFESKIRPLLIERCYECHSQEAGESNGDLYLDNAAGTLQGGSLGPALVPGQPDRSLVIRAVEYKDNQLQMPPDSKLSDESIALLRQWIQMGAPDPRDEQHSRDHGSHMQRDPKTHWAFVAPRAVAPESAATMQHEVKSRDRLDVFAAERAAERGLEIAIPASRETLVRRLYFDLTGLPPTRDEVESFVQSTRPDAYARLVDRLMASPEFGERFARHWMDVARYADTVGYALGGKERRIKGSERFRDWTIKAFAQDMPYDQMVLQQLAGDRTDPKNEAGNLDAMGFLTVGRRFLNGLDTIDDRIDVITRGLLAMTVTCARCHDHKFDPIPTTDYYSLFGVLQNSEAKVDGPSPLMMVDKNHTPDHPVLVRGQQGNHGPIAPRQFLTSLRQEDEPRFTDGSGRWELAQRIIDPDNPLTSRVMVNRIWGHLIGKPLVESPSDFGFRTPPPAVPEVLDDLSAEFATHWSVKRLVRRIVMTRIYQQSAASDATTIDRDPANEFLARANRKRRDFESLRDSMLWAADSLDLRLGGDPV